jgi:HK97 gp10 family phage protein
MPGEFVRIDGLRELGEAMRTLSADVQQRVSRQATGAGAAVVKNGVKKQLRANPTVDTELLLQNIVTRKVSKSKTTLTSEHVVTVRKKDYPAQRGKSRRNTLQVAIYKEFGTVKMSKEAFLQPGFDSTKERAAQIIADRLRKRIEAVRK